MLDEPRIMQTTAQPAAVIRFTIPRAEVGHVMGPGHRELMAAVAAQGITPTGPWFTHHLRMDPETFDFELGVPIATPFSAAGRVTPGTLPAATVARTIYRGAYEGLPSAWAEFDSWIAAAGHIPGPDLWECYATGPESGPDPSTWKTELTRPLSR